VIKDQETKEDQNLVVEVQKNMIGEEEADLIPTNVAEIKKKRKE